MPIPAAVITTIIDSIGVIKIGVLSVREVTKLVCTLNGNGLTAII